MAKARPIIFSAAMVRALLAGTKTQTRRICKGAGAQVEPQKYRASDFDLTTCPYGVPGDRLWVREAWRTYESLDHLAPRDIGRGAGVEYVAGGSNVNGHEAEKLHGMGRYRHSQFLPRWASRITLEVTDVRVERLQEISEDDAILEGALEAHDTDRQVDSWARWTQRVDPGAHVGTARGAFAALWERIHGPNSWAASPWVWAITFKPVPRDGSGEGE
jgi:hypothetical protein